MRYLLSAACLVFIVRLLPGADPLPVVGGVEGQPLGANVERVGKALEFLGTPLPADLAEKLAQAITAKDAKKIQELLDPRALLQVTINPESRVKVANGPGSTTIQQAGFTPVLVKVVNEAVVKKQLRSTARITRK
jgi:hypothetical protein